MPFMHNLLRGIIVGNSILYKPETISVTTYVRGELKLRFNLFCVKCYTRGLKDDFQ